MRCSRAGDALRRSRRLERKRRTRPADDATLDARREALVSEIRGARHGARGPGTSSQPAPPVLRRRVRRHRPPSSDVHRGPDFDRRDVRRGDARLRPATDPVARVVCVPRRDVTGLLGPNGAGKTTLLGQSRRRACGASQGHRAIWVAGPEARDPDLRARVGWLGHDPGLYPELTARENLAVLRAPATVCEPHVRGGDAPRTADAHLAGRRSGVVAIRAACDNDSVSSVRCCTSRESVLLDEPFTGLDAASIRALLHRLTALKAAGASSSCRRTISISWNPLLDAAVVLREGRVAGELPRRRDCAGGTCLPRSRRSAAREVVPGEGSRERSSGGPPGRAGACRTNSRKSATDDRRCRRAWPLRRFVSIASWSHARIATSSCEAASSS